MQNTLKDLGSGISILTRSPGPAALAILILAVGIGLTVAMFSIVHGIVLRGLPIERADELLHVQAQRLEKGISSQPVTLPQFLDWRQEQSSFRELHAFDTDSVFLSGDGLPERLSAGRITPGAFGHLGIQPMMGREFATEDTTLGAEPVTLLSYSVWQRVFGARDDILGRSIRIDRRPATIVGVMPRGFQFPERQEIWFPLTLDMGDLPRGEAGADLNVFGRLREGFSIDQARADLTAISDSLARRYPDVEDSLGPVLQRYTDFYLNQEDANLGWTSLGAVTFVLLIACFNVANLLLARATRRTRELAMRSALGAGQWRIARQVLGESFILSFSAAIAGIGLSLVLIQQFNFAVADRDWPFWYDVRLDWSAGLVVVGITVLVTILVGAIPAWSSSRIDVGAVLKNESSGTSRSRTSAALVIAEVALSCTLLVGAGLMVRTLANLADLDHSFDVNSLYAGRVSLMSEIYPDWDSLGQAWDSLERTLSEIPEVENAAIIDSVPAAEWATMRRYSVEGELPADPKDQPHTRFARVSENLFDTLGVNPTIGRVFGGQDRLGSTPVVVVNQSFAQRHWPQQSPLGKTVRLDLGGADNPWREIVGVVPDLNAGGPRDQRPEAVYLPLDQAMSRTGAIVARMRSDAASADLKIREAVAKFDPDLPVYFSGSLREKIAEQLFFYRMVGAIFTIMAIAALLLATSGLYGLLSFSVNRRMPELGVRMAVGASAGNILNLIMKGGLRQVSVGLVLGLVLAVVVAKLIESQLVGVQPHDLITFMGVALTLLATGFCTVLIAGIRASRVDPVDTLRCE